MVNRTSGWFPPGMVMTVMSTTSYLRQGPNAPSPWQRRRGMSTHYAKVRAVQSGMESDASHPNENVRQRTRAMFPGSF